MPDAAMIGVIASGRDQILDATRTLGSHTIPATDAAWSPEAFAERPSDNRIMAANRRNASGGRLGRFSDDGGATWTVTTSTFPDARSFGDVVWAAAPFNAFWAVQNQGTGTRQAASSSDGDTWSWENITPNQLMNGVCWVPPTDGPGSSFLIAVGASGGIGRKLFGGSWAAASSVPASTLMWRVCWSPERGILVAVGVGGAIWTSPDGDVWTARTSGVSVDLHGVAWSPKLRMFAAVGGPNETVVTSPDGITWTPRTTPDRNRTPFRVRWFPEISEFLVLSAGTGLTSVNTDSLNMRSADGVTWSAWNTTGHNRVWRGLGWSSAEHRVLGGAYDGTPWVATNRITYWSTSLI